MKARALHKSLLLVKVILACQILTITYNMARVKITISTVSNVMDNIPAAKNNTGTSKRLTKCWSACSTYLGGFSPSNVLKYLQLKPSLTAFSHLNLAITPT